jgi:hypothetical protein
MVTVIIIVMAFGVYVGFCYYKGQGTEEVKSADEVNEQQLEGEKKSGCIPTRVLVIRTLQNMGCTPVVGERENIYFDYQGEHFFIAANNDCRCIEIYDTWWGRFSMDGDIEDFARMQKAVNLINASSSCTVLYSYDYEEREVGVHAHQKLLFIEQIPDIESYLAAMLNGFFKAQRDVRTEMEICRKMDEQKVNR